nr:MAG TPA: hypothetical protein [Caudoviricetes sp.]
MHECVRKERGEFCFSYLARDVGHPKVRVLGDNDGTCFGGFNGVRESAHFRGCVRESLDELNAVSRKRVVIVAWLPFGFLGESCKAFSAFSETPWMNRQQFIAGDRVEASAVFSFSTAFWRVERGNGCLVAKVGKRHVADINLCGHIEPL